MDLNAIKMKFRCEKTLGDLEYLGGYEHHCSDCNLTVHDLSAMTRDDAEVFLKRRRLMGERTCVTYQHEDGRPIFQDKPYEYDAARHVQLEAQRRGTRLIAGAAVIVIGAAGVGLALSSSSDDCSTSGTSSTLTKRLKTLWSGETEREDLRRGINTGDVMF